MQRSAEVAFHEYTIQTYNLTKPNPLDFPSLDVATEKFLMGPNSSNAASRSSLLVVNAKFRTKICFGFSFSQAWPFLDELIAAAVAAV